MNDTYLTVQGWVGGDVVLTDVGGGTQVATFRLGSTPRRLRDGAWSDGETCWHTVKVWRALAANVAESVHRGDPVVVHGRLVADAWDKPDGTTSVRHVLEAVTVGHDLARGTARFTRSPRAAQQAGVDRGLVSSLVHAQDEDGPRLDQHGEPVEVTTSAA